MNQVSGGGPCLCEDTNKIEELKNSSGSIGSNDTSLGIHVSCGRPSSSEISTQPIVGLYENSVQEGAEPINCNVNISLKQKNDENEALAEDKSIITYQKRKRLKTAELSDPPTDLEIIGEDRVGSTSLDHLVELESMKPCCYENMSEKKVIAEDGISVESVEGKIMEETLGCCLDIQNISSNDDDKVLSDKSNGNTTNENFSNVEVHDVEFVKEDIGNCQRDSSGDALGVDNPLHHDEQSVASDADGLEAVASQVVNEIVNVAVDKAFANYNGKKLLVLDLNGLLVHISSYVPYDYDPDDIILKKAVFKRPYCDDFLKFCFEKFNVGFWSSRTKYSSTFGLRNMEPILDLLLGNDKCKLVFCWDQSQCTDTGFYTIERKRKPLLLKKLKKLWDKSEPDLPWEKGVYNETNTLLLDDTPYKALSNPRYTAIFPHTYRFTDVSDNSLGPGGDLRVYLEGLATADNVQEYVKQNPFGQRAITEKNLSWGYYRKVIEASTTPPRHTTPPQQTEEDGS